VPSQPSKRSFYHPPSGEHLKSFWFFIQPEQEQKLPLPSSLPQMLGYGRCHFQGRLDVTNALALIPRVHQHFLESGKPFGKAAIHQAFDSHPVGQRSAMDLYLEQEPLRIGHNMAFAAFDFFACIVATRPPFSLVFTLWLSMRATLGCFLRPSFSRTFSRSR